MNALGGAARPKRHPSRHLACHSHAQGAASPTTTGSATKRPRTGQERRGVATNGHTHTHTKKAQPRLPTAAFADDGSHDTAPHRLGSTHLHCRPPPASYKRQLRTKQGQLAAISVGIVGVLQFPALLVFFSFFFRLFLFLFTFSARAFRLFSEVVHEVSRCATAATGCFAPAQTQGKAILRSKTRLAAPRTPHESRRGRALIDRIRT